MADLSVLKAVAALVAAIDTEQPDQQTYEQLRERVTSGWRDPYNHHGSRGGQEQSVAVRAIADFVLRKHEAMAENCAKDPAPAIYWRVAYFGCRGGPGHFLYGGWWGGRAESLLVNGSRLHLDQGFLPPNQRGCREHDQPEGVAWLTHTDEGLTVLSFWDRSVDPRGGSLSAFIVDGRVDFETAVRFSKAMWPSIWSRFTFTVTKGGHL